MSRYGKPKVLILGGTGTVGSAVVEVFAQSGEYEVHSVSRDKAPSQPNVISQNIDLQNGSLSSILAGVDFEHIVDCAQPRYTLNDTRDFSIQHIKNIELLCSDSTKSLVYTSGVWIYGHQPVGSQINEESLLAPFSYAKPRIPVLEYLTESDYPWIQLCLPSIVYGSCGPFQDMLEKIKNDNLDTVEDETILWSVIERGDLARAYLAVVQEKPSRGLYCIAEPEAVRVVDFFESIARVLGKPIPKRSETELSKSQSKEVLEVTLSSQPVDSSLFLKDTSWKAKYCYLRDFHKFIY